MLQVWPDSHKLKGNNYYFSNLPPRFQLWKDLVGSTDVTPLPEISPAWLATYRCEGAFLGAGWLQTSVEVAVVCQHGHKNGGR